MTAPALRTSASSADTLETRLAREQSTLRARSMAAVVLAVIGVVALALVCSAWLMADGRWMTLPRAVPIAMWVAALAGATGLVWSLRKRNADVLSLTSLAAAIEREQALRSGSLRGALEVAGTGALGARASQDVARRLAPGALAPQVAQRLGRGVTVAGVLAAITVGALSWSAREAPDGFAATVHPVRAWRGTLLPALGFDKLPTLVPRGMPVSLRVRADGRNSVTISRRAEGEAWRDTTLSVRADGMVTLALGAVSAPITVRVNDGRAPELNGLITVADRGWIGDVALFADYPAYLGRTDESMEPVPPLRVPRGTHVRVTAMLRGGARDAMLTDGRDTVRFPASANGAAVSATISLDHDGSWSWIASATPSADAATLPPELPDALAFTVVPDKRPEVAIVSPGSDTAIGPTGIVPVYIDASDDHGVSNVSLQVWRESVGAGGPVTRERIDVASPSSPLFQGGASITLDGRKLEPGDRLHVTAIATDDSPWRQTTVSAEVLLRVPSLTEQRAMARALADSLAAQAQRLAQQEKRLQQNTDNAARNRDLKGGGTSEEAKANGTAKTEGGKSQSMSFSAAEKAKQLARDQQQLGAKVDSLRQNAKELESRLKNANALDTALASRMKDIQKLLRDAMTPEMQKQLEELSKNSDRLSGTEAQKSMQQLGEQQKQMREQLEKSAEMLKRAALEGAMQTLRDDAKDLAKEQKQAADRMDGRQSESRQSEGRQESAASSPKELADRARELEREVQALAKRLEEAGAKPGASKTRAAQPLVSQAADAMQKAAQAQQQNGPKQAGEKAGEQGQPKPGEKDPNAAGKEPGQDGAAGQKQPGGEPKPGAEKSGAQPNGQQGQQGTPQPGQQGQSQQGGKPQAGQQGDPGDQARKAADAMDKAAQQLSAARDAQVDAWKTELSSELDQSINETMQLARQQSELEQKARSQGAQGMQGEQSALQQGVQQAAERLEKAGRSSSLLSQRSQKAMGEAQRRVEQATQQMQQSGQPGGSEQAQNAMKDASEALNQALSSLVRDREKMNGAQSASGFTEMMEQLKQLAQQQGQLNGQMQGLNMLPGGAKGDAARQQSRVLAKQQRDVARSLNDVSDADQTGRMDALAKEAQTLSQQIERNGIDPAVAARQAQLYRRLLDAGRFLEQDERDDQGPREAKAANGNGASGRVDGAQSGKAANKFAPPTWNELRGLGPDERRIVIEYFRKLNGTTPP
ncbi:hypothetical protein [Gemmatimonas sp.]|uniref:hypothetical protein n=1 Tax=Gemmatimonas sp. TaxID=1962908 RepID=UPI00286D61BD|nr:hypothetical protein [Gemmatimonas sp.]